MQPFYPSFGKQDVNRPCLRDDSAKRWMTYGELTSNVEQCASHLEGSKGLVFAFIDNNIQSVVSLLAAIRAGHTVALIDPLITNESRRLLIDRYSPDYIIDPNQTELTKINVVRDSISSIHPDLSVLLSTSGSTGSPKFVRLTLDSILSNARAIASTLEIKDNDIASGHLPLHYSFGFSTLTSHLFKGASVYLTKLGFFDKSFWSAMRDAGITHLPGVPFHFKTLERMGYNKILLPKLKSLAQAGGFLDVKSRHIAFEYMSHRGGRFYVMYGQTEAAPRMTTLPHEEFNLAPSSVGRALPGGMIELLDIDANGHGEVVYSGPNVMMGYAECRADLARGDENCGRLVTGDIGTLDALGRLTLTGRVKRFGKLYGLRINLDEIEQLANTICEAAVTQTTDHLVIHVVDPRNSIMAENLKAELLTIFKKHYTVPHSSFRIYFVNEIPRTARGKIDYRAIEEKI